MIKIDGFDIHLEPLKKWNNGLYNRWRNEPSIWAWCRQNDAISMIHQEEWYEDQELDPTIRMYEIVYDNKPVGVCGLTSIDHVNQKAEFSLYIGPEYQGKGFAKAGLKLLCKHGFNNLNLNCIWGETYDGNPAALLFSNIGFKSEGTQRQRYFRNGKFIDVHIYSLLRSECSF